MRRHITVGMVVILVCGCCILLLYITCLQASLVVPEAPTYPAAALQGRSRGGSEDYPRITEDYTTSATYNDVVVFYEDNGATCRGNEDGITCRGLASPEFAEYFVYIHEPKADTLSYVVEIRWRACTLDLSSTPNSKLLLIL